MGHNLQLEKHCFNDVGDRSKSAKIEGPELRNLIAPPTLGGILGVCCRLDICYAPGCRLEASGLTICIPYQPYCQNLIGKIGLLQTTGHVTRCTDWRPQKWACLVHILQKQGLVVAPTVAMPRYTYKKTPEGIQPWCVNIPLNCLRQNRVQPPCCPNQLTVSWEETP